MSILCVNMEKEQNKLNIIEMAKKKRHIYLLEKLQKNQPLSRAEINELGPLEQGSIPLGYVATQEEVAEIFTVSARTVRRWVENGMPRDPQGYNIKKISEWCNLMRSEHGTVFKEFDDISETWIVGIRRGIMFFEETLLLNSEIISEFSAGKSPKEIKEFLTLIIERFSEKLLERHDLDPRIEGNNRDDF